ncbi:MFS transporter [Pseudomonas frederiksbergensis]|nr:MFS transporter [Pseudomonas frederiksbergensis]KHK61560.2 MFS transporter [Pseudomonas frederiksbergensis]
MPAADSLSTSVVSDSKSVSRRAAIAASTGTAVEYYEFGVYGYMAAVIAPLFFPGDNPAAALLASLAVFGSAFLTRPLGGIILGRLGDRIGRRGVLLTTVIGMGLSTTLIGFLPTTAQAGIIAPILLVLIRLAQGFFAGAEVVGAAAFVAESAPAHRRGFFGSFTPVGVAIGGGTAACVCGVVTLVLSPEALQEWGWRIPFLLCVPLVLLSCKLRHNVEETPEYQEFLKKDKPPAAPVREVMTKHLGKVVRVFILAFGQNVGYFIGIVFMNIYLTTYLKFEKSHVYWAIASISFIVAAMMPFWGAVSDRLGRRRTLAIGFGGYVLLVVPMMALMDGASIWVAGLALLIATLPMPIIQSVGYPTYAEQFPTRVRYTGMAIAINLGAIMGGGLGPFISSALIGSTGNLLMPGYFLAGAALLSLLSLLFLNETAGKQLER